MFVNVSHFHPSLKFVVKVGAKPLGMSANIVKCGSDCSDKSSCFLWYTI
jgi:hypothetical protein